MSKTFTTDGRRLSQTEPSPHFKDKSASVGEDLWSIFICLIILSVFCVARAEADDAGLSFTGGKVASVDTHTVVIEWQTNVPTNGRVDYGEDVHSANRVALVIDLDTFHQTLLYGLREGEEHVYRVFASDTRGRDIRTNWMSFRTSGVPAPRITKVDIHEITWHSATIIWTSNIPVKGKLECGYDTAYGYSKQESKFGMRHEVRIDQFSPLKTIAFKISAVDKRGLYAVPYEARFQTEELNIAQGAAVRGTFHHNPERPYITDSPPILQRVTDGSTSYFKGMSTSADPADTDQWVEIDLGEIKDAAAIVTIWRRLAYPKQFRLRGSLDGERWYEFGDTYSADFGTTITSHSQTGDPIWIHTASIGQYSLRYVRLEIPQGAPYHKKFQNYTFVQLYELKVYPPEPDDLFLKLLKQSRK